MPARRKRRKALRNKRRTFVSVTAEAHAWMKAAAEARGMSLRQLVDVVVQKVLP